MTDGRSQSATRAGSTGTAHSRVAQARRAVRKATKARLALSGSSGSGKTFTALSIAQVLVPDGRYLVIDSEPGDGEQGAAELYADLFDFDTIEWAPPFDPRDLALTIRDLGQPNQEGWVYDVVIVDSASHFWRGSGGTLDIAGGRFGGWKEATPAQDDLVLAVLRSPFHMILCTRAKQAYAVDDDGGRQKVTKLGLEPIQRDDLEYEMQVAATIDGQHRIEFSKTRCHTLAGRAFPANQQGVFAQLYREWLDSGAQLLRMADVAALRQAVKAVADEGLRKQVAADFRAAFGLGEQIAADKLAACWAWMAAALDMDPHRFGEDEETGACTRCGVVARAGWHTNPPQEAPVAPQEAQERPEAPEGATTTPEAPEATHDPQVASGGPAAEDSSEADRMGAAVAYAKTLRKSDLVEALGSRGLNTAGNMDALGLRLVQALMREGWQPADQPAMV